MKKRSPSPKKRPLLTGPGVRPTKKDDSKRQKARGELLPLPLHQENLGPWMSTLALVAAESRVDGGAGLHRLLQHAKFDERPHLSLTKRKAA